MRNIILVILLSVFSGFLGAGVFGILSSPIAPAVAPEVQEKAFADIMHTGKIRCGYASAPPLFMEDPNTGEMSGIAYEVVEAIGKSLSLEIEWAEEVGWATFPAALNSGRIDAFCVGAWPNSARAREIYNTQPISYQPYYAYVRADDHRFDKDISLVNDSSVRLSVMDGDTSQAIAKNDFPKATVVGLIESVQPDEMLHNVATNKADVAFVDPIFFSIYEKTNPEKLRKLETGPLRVFGNVFFVAQGEDKLRLMLNTSITEQLSSDVIEGIIKRYEEVPGTFLRVATPYQ